MENAAAPTVEVIRLGQLAIRYLQHAGGGCAMGMFELTVPPGANVPPPHSHPGNVNDQEHMPEGLEAVRFYDPGDAEPTMRERLAAARNARRRDA